MVSNINRSEICHAGRHLSGFLFQSRFDKLCTASVAAIRKRLERLANLYISEIGNKTLIFEGKMSQVSDFFLKHFNTFPDRAVALVAIRT